MHLMKFKARTLNSRTLNARFFLACAIAIWSGSSFVLAETADGPDIQKIDELAPLSEYVTRPQDRIIPEYLFLRCSGFLLGQKYYGGATFNEQTKKGVEQNIERFRTAGILVKIRRVEKSTGRKVDDELLSSMADEAWGQINEFAFFYDDRMKDNFLKTGVAWSEDPLLMGDFKICAEMVQLANQIAGGSAAN